MWVRQRPAVSVGASLQKNTLSLELCQREGVLCLCCCADWVMIDILACGPVGLWWRQQEVEGAPKQSQMGGPRPAKSLGANNAGKSSSMPAAMDWSKQVTGQPSLLPAQLHPAGADCDQEVHDHLVIPRWTHVPTFTDRKTHLRLSHRPRTPFYSKPL